MTKYHVRLEFIESVLGTVPLNKELYSDYVASKNGGVAAEVLEEELETVPEVEDKGVTGFHEAFGHPFLYDYVLKGFFKDACGMLRRADGTLSKKLTAYKKIIDGLMFVSPRRLLIHLPEDEPEMGVLERPLRAQTAQGERVALAKSQTCPVGSWIEFDVTVLGSVSEALLREWMEYGQMRGLGQWRNAGYGAFVFEMEKVA